jgi:hypothetical protein
MKLRYILDYKKYELFPWLYGLLSWTVGVISFSVWLYQRRNLLIVEPFSGNVS